MSSVYVAFGFNESEPDVAFGALRYRALDPEVCKRLRAESGALLVDAIIDVVAYRAGSLVRSSFLRGPNNQWIPISAGSARIYLVNEHYDQDAIEEALAYE